MKTAPLTDEEHRMDYLVGSGLKVAQARQHVRTQKPGISESWYIVAQRIREFGKLMEDFLKNDRRNKM